MMTAKPSFTFVLKDSIYLIKLDNTLRTQQSISKLTHKNRKEKGLSRSILHFRHLCEMYENQIIESHKFKFQKVKNGCVARFMDKGILWAEFFMFDRIEKVDFSTFGAKVKF